MKKNFNYFIGVDVSKDKLDITVLESKGEFVLHQEVQNSEKQISKYLTSLIKRLNTSLDEMLFCLEHTGVYGFPLCAVLSEVKVDYAMVAANEIKYSTGIKRGKNDKADSEMIAEYAYLRGNKLTFYQLPTKKLQAIKILLSRRELLVNDLKGVKNSSKETNEFIDNEYLKLSNKRIAVHIKCLQDEIKALENDILSIIKDDDNLKRLYELITSVVGIGFVTATNLIVVTNGFTSFEDARQLASYCGVAPFSYSSGSSIKGRTRVHHLANKKLKSLLSMVVMNAIKGDKELKAYYERKQKEGKNNMLILNNIKNKILARVVSVIKRKTPYVPLHNHIN